MVFFFTAQMPRYEKKKIQNQCWILWKFHLNRVLYFPNQFSAGDTRISVASIFQHSVFAVWWILFIIAEHPIDCVPCIQVRCFNNNLCLFNIHIFRQWIQNWFRFRYKNRPVMSGPGLYDPTSIMNADTLAKCQREGWIKLAVYLLSFFYYLYG